MKINSVQNVSYRQFANTQNKNKTNMTQPLSEVKFPVADNYGRAMVNFQAGRTKNIQHMVMKAPLEDKISVVLSTLQPGELLVTSKNLKISIELIKENIRAVTFPIKKILHLHNPKLEETLAYSVNPENGMFDIYNFNESMMEIEDLGIPLLIDTGESQSCGLGGIVKSSIGNLQIKNESEYIDYDFIEAYLPTIIDEYDYEGQFTISTVQHNNLVLNEQPQKEVVKRGPFFRDVGGQDKVIEQLEDQMLFPFIHPEAYPGIMPALGAILYGNPVQEKLSWQMHLLTNPA